MLCGNLADTLWIALPPGAVTFLNRRLTTEINLCRCPVLRPFNSRLALHGIRDSLLQHMCQLMGQKAFPFSCSKRILSLAEDNIPSKGEGSCVY